MSSRLVFGGQPLLTGGCLVSSNSGAVAVLTSRGVALLSLDLDPAWQGQSSSLNSNHDNELTDETDHEFDADNGGEGFCFRLTCSASLRDSYRLPLAIDPAMLKSISHLPDAVTDPLRSFHILARQFPASSIIIDEATKTIKQRKSTDPLVSDSCHDRAPIDGFVKADWSPFERFGRGCLAAVSNSGRLVLLGCSRSLIEAESMRVIAEPGQSWCSAYVQVGRVVQSESSDPTGELNFLSRTNLTNSDVDDKDSTGGSYIWCDRIDEFTLAIMDMCFAGVSWSRQMRPKPWHALLAGVTRSGILVLFSYNPASQTAALLHATYAASSINLNQSDTLTNFGLQACSIRLCDLTASSNSTEADSSLLALIGLCDGRVLGIKIRLINRAISSDCIALTSAGPDWCLWRWPDQLQMLDAVWSTAERFGCVAKGAHLVSFSLKRGEGVAASTVTTSVNSLQITGLACVGRSIYYCCLDGRLFRATFAPDTTSTGVASSNTISGVVCSSISELHLTHSGPPSRVLDPNSESYYYGLYCSRNGVLIGVLEGRSLQCGRRSKHKLAFRLTCGVGEDRLVELLRSADRPIGQKLDVLEAVRHVYYRDKFTSANFLGAELDGLTEIMRNPATILALGSELHNLRVLRFLLSLAGGQAAMTMARAIEGLMILKHCGIALRYLLRMVGDDLSGKQQQQQLLKRQQNPSDRDLLVLDCMLDALRLACDADPRLLGAARSAWRLDSIIERAKNLLVQYERQREQQQQQQKSTWKTCIVCQSDYNSSSSSDSPTSSVAMPSMDHLAGVCCRNGHAFARCYRSLLPVTGGPESGAFLRCSLCPASSLTTTSSCFLPDVNVSEQVSNDWLAWLLSSDACLFCDAPILPIQSSL